jgi:hypothetical protein
MLLQTAIDANTINDSGGTTSVAGSQALFSKLAKLKPSRAIGVDPAATAPMIARTSQLQAAIKAADWSDASNKVASLLHALTRAIKDKMDASLAESLRSSVTRVLANILALVSSFGLRYALGTSLLPKNLPRAFFSKRNTEGDSAAAGSLESENVYSVYDALGRGALQRNDFDAAQKYLILAATSVGGKALLDLGYKETVVAFLTSCKAFWPNPKVDGWISQIRQGQTPVLSPLY